MDKILELLKRIFANEPEKIKAIEEYKLDKDDADNLKQLQAMATEMLGKKSSEANDTGGTKSSGSDDIKNIIAGLTEQIRMMQQIIAEQTKKQEDRERAIAEEAKKAHEKKITEIIDKAIKEGKIPAKNEQEIARWKNLFEKDYESAEFALSKIEGSKAAAQDTAKQDESKPVSKFGSTLRPEIAKYVENIPIIEN
jgi:hypothetical protein